jgi:replicative DNA helicase
VAVSVPPEAAGSVPPHNLEAETSVLGAVLLAEQALDGVLIDVRLTAEDFYRERNRLVFRAMMRLKEKAVPEPIDALTVSEELTRSGELEEAGGTAYVHSLPALVPAAGNARHYAKIVKEHALLRRLLDTTRDIQEKALAVKGEPSDLVEQAEQAMYKIAHDEHASEVRSIESILHVEIDKLHQLSREGVSLIGTPSGFRDLDDLTGGFQPGNLIVLAARPGMGKSALVVNFAENAAVDNGKSVALFSLEMSESELAQRLIASRAKVNGDLLRKGKVKEETWPKIVRASDELSPASFFIDDSSDIGVMELRAKARRLHSRHDLDLIIVDYLQLMRPDDTSTGRVEQIGQISRGLKILARELHVPVIAVSQLSRAVEARPDKRPLLSDLRESGSIEQDADVVLFIYRDEYYNSDSESVGEAEIKIAKHRNGPIDTIRLAFFERYPKFASLWRGQGIDPVAGADANGTG